MDAIERQQLDQIADLGLIVNDQADQIRNLRRSLESTRTLAKNLDDESQRINLEIRALAIMVYGGAQWVRRDDVLAIIHGGHATPIGPKA